MMNLDGDMLLYAEIEILYPYFNTDDLARIYNMSRGWMARKIVASGVVRRTASETRELVRPSVLPYDVYRVYGSVIERTGGSLDYPISCGENYQELGDLPSVEELFEEFTELEEEFTELEEEFTELEDELFAEMTELEEEQNQTVTEEVAEPVTEEPEPVTEEPVVEEPVVEESVEEPTDLISQLRKEKDFNTMIEAYDYLTDITRELGRHGVFSDLYEAEYAAKIKTTPPIELGFSRLSALKNTVKNGVGGAEWEVILRVNYLPTYTDTERLGNYLMHIQQNDQVFAGRFRTDKNDRLSIRVTSTIE